MDNTHFDTNEYDLKGMELEEIEYLIAGNAEIEYILERFPHYNKREIDKIVDKVARFLWLDEKEYWEFNQYVKPLSLNELKYNENGECITDLLTKSFSEFYLTKRFKETQ